MEMADPNENPSHLTLPANQAALAPFPPGCPVLVNVGSESSGGETYLGQIHSVYIDLGSATRDNFYRVRPSAPTEADSDLRSAPESALKYAPGCTVTADASALPPFVTEGGGDARNATVISCVSGSSSRYYLLDVAPGPDDSWTNIQSTVPADAVRYRDLGEEVSNVPAAQPAAAAAAAAGAANDDNPAWIISPHPHTIPADEDGSLISSLCAPPVPSISFDTDANKSRKRSAGQLEDRGGGSSTLSPMPTDSSISVASKDATSEEVVRRINIPESVDVNKIKGALVGPEYKINQRMQAKFRVTISILGLEDVIGPPPDGVIAVEPFTKLGPIAFKAGDKCVMIRGSNRKVHDAAKVVIHMLANKCYDGDDKDALTRELRVVRQVRKKAESPRAMSESLPPPTKKVKTGPTEGLDAAKSIPIGAATSPKREWSPPIDEDPQPEITGDGQSRPSQQPSYYGRAIDGVTQQNNRDAEMHPHGPLRLVSSPVWVGSDAVRKANDWRVIVKSPIPVASVYGCLVGKGGENMKHLESKFSKVFFNIRGEGLRSKKGAQSEGPLRVEVEGNDKGHVLFAARHVADILDYGPLDERVPTDSASCQRLDTTRESGRSRLDQSSTSVMPSAQRQLIMGKPFFDGRDWGLEVLSPLDPNWTPAATPLGNTRTFKLLIGEGGSRKKGLLAMFPGPCSFCLRGDGIKDQNGMPTDGPLRLFIKSPHSELVGNFAEHIAGVLVNEEAGDGLNSNGHHQAEDYYGPTGATPNFATNAHSTTSALNPRDLFIGTPRYDDQTSTWSLEARSPVDEHTAFGCLIGDGGKTKRDIISRFNFQSSKIYFCLRGDGIRSKGGVDTSGPLRVFVQGPDSKFVVSAADHLAGILLEQHQAQDAATRSNTNYRVDPRSYDHYGGGSGFGNCGGGGGDDEPERHREQMYPPSFHNETSHGPHNPMQLLGEPFYARSMSRWAVQVHSPLGEQPLFNVIVGDGGVNKKKLTRAFPNAFFTIAGRGVRSNGSVPRTRSDEPLHVLVEASDQEYLLKAASHVAAIVSDVARSSAASDQLRRGRFFL